MLLKRMMTILVGLSLLMAGPLAAADAKPLNVYAAASLVDALGAIGQLYTAASGQEVKLNTASSSTLARQIAAGAPADLYISAEPLWADYLAEQGLTLKASRCDLLYNRLVVIAPPTAKPPKISFARGFDFAASFGGRLAVGDPTHVPAGRYAAQAFDYYGWSAALNGRLLPCASVREALRVVELGEAELGVVYATDALASDKVKQVGVFPAASHKPITYVAVCLKSGDTLAAQAFLKFLRGPKGAEIFKRQGFLMQAAR